MRRSSPVPPRWLGYPAGKPLVPMLVAGVTLVLAAIAPGSGVRTAQAQFGNVGVPGFWDPRRRPERPDLTRLSVIRFITETDYPPFNFAGPDGNPQGFNVELARLICDELKVSCTVQMRRFETLITALNANQADAAIASIATTPLMRTRVDFTDPYYRTPARFVAKRDSPIDDALLIARRFTMAKSPHRQAAGCDARCRLGARAHRGRAGTRRANCAGTVRQCGRARLLGPATAARAA